MVYVYLYPSRGGMGDYLISGLEIPDAEEARIYSVPERRHLSYETFLRQTRDAETHSRRSPARAIVPATACSRRRADRVLFIPRQAFETFAGRVTASVARCSRARFVPAAQAMLET